MISISMILYRNGVLSIREDSLNGMHLMGLHMLSGRLREIPTTSISDWRVMAHR